MSWAPEPYYHGTSDSWKAPGPAEFAGYARGDYPVTEIRYQRQRMLALVTETTHCDALDGPETVITPAGPSGREMTRKD